MPDDAALIELATLYYSCANTDALLRTFAARLGVGLGAGTVHVWLPEDGTGLRCRARWSEPGMKIEPESEPEEESPLFEAMEGGETIEWRPEEQEADELGHLAPAARGQVSAALYLPLPGPRSPLGVAEARRMIYQHQLTDLATAIREDFQGLSKLFGSADFKEGRTAFMEKRKPVWQGK